LRFTFTFTFSKCKRKSKIAATGSFAFTITLLTIFKMAVPLEVFAGALHNLLLFDDHAPGDEERVLLYNAITDGRSKEQTHDPDWPRLDLEQLTRPQTFGFFRFDAEDIRLLSQMLGLPEKIIVLPSRNTISGEEGLCMLPRRKSNRNCTYAYLATSA
jgi:hypothetical protein